MSDRDMPAPRECVAVIGMSGRFPKAKNLDEYWQRLRDGIECISFFPEENVGSSGEEEELKGSGIVHAGGVLEDIDLFDARFFGFSARDAEVMDPQQRLFLETAWQSLEDAAYNPETYPGLIGVFAGSIMSSYIFDLYRNHEARGFIDDFQVWLGNDKDHLTTQVSYKLNLRGPSMAVQTACSTSLVTICLACQSLLSYQCDMALAGGISIDSATATGYFYQPGGILSPDGHCRVFDASAKGTLPGNGVGVVVLKRLSEALADRDHIYAVVKGSALNNDGSLKVGYTAPSVNGQAQVIAMAQALAGVSPETISYIEAHGTGTPLGDPIELAALNQVFRARTKKKGFCAVGAVKSNIGHLDTAAGVAGFIKTVLALQHKLLPPSLHCRQPNPKINFEDSPFYVNTKLSEWQSNGHPRRAGVSSFSIGGTNAHAILEEAPAVELSQHPRPCCLLTLSARTSAALETATDNLVEYLTGHPAIDLTDAAYSYQVGRKAFTHRRALVCRSLEAADVRSALEKRDPQQIFTDVSAPKERPVYFMFPGQGTQHVDMARQVYDVEATFRAEVDRCSEILRPNLQLDLRELLFPANDRREEAARTLGRTAFTQAALFTVEYAVAKLWMEWGVCPSAMIGHSIGEYVAACLAGVFSLEDALALVAMRGQLMDQMPPGSMLAVPLPESAAKKYLGDGLSLAAVNGPSSCVLSGATHPVDHLAEEFSQSGMRCHRLHTSHAFHSSLMDPIKARFADCVKAVALKPPQIPYISNVTGTWITAKEATSPGYWGRQLRATVRFGDGLQTLLETPDCILLEAGPGQTLSNLARQQPGRGVRQVVISSLSSVRDSQSDVPSLLTTLGKLWLGGTNVNWEGFYRHDRCHRIPLPGYPFERQRYWIGVSETEETPEEIDLAPAERELRFYYPCWKPAMRLAASLENGEPQLERRWLVFGRADGLTSQLTQQLRERGGHVTTVLIGERFARLETDSYSIRPGEPADYETLLQDILIRTRLPDRIAHLWTLTSVDERSDDDVLERSQQLGFYSLASLARALEINRLKHSIQITVVSNQLYSVIGDEPLCPAKATVLGPCKVIPQESPNIRCQSVDMDLSGSGQEESELIGRLVSELTVGPFEPVVAYRKGRRWIQTFEAVQLDEGAESITSLRQGGVYLITGGLGKIGLVLAESLARTAGAKLVLTGRSPFPERSEWEQRLKDDGVSVISDKIRKLLELEELGAEVMTFSADSADTEQMRRVIDAAKSRFGAIHGVIHGAGNTTTAFCSVRQIHRGAAEQQFRPKVGGLLALMELFDERDLDFVLLLSSLSAQLGGPELAAYAAANSFLDAQAIQRNREGRVPWISVNWDGWYFPEEGEVDPETDLILPEEGEIAFRQILERAPAQIIVSASDLHARVDRWIKFRSDQERPESNPSAESTQHPRPGLPNAYIAPRTSVEMTMAEIWQQLLGVSPVGAFDNFFELGGHSLLAIQVISRLRETFGIEFPLQRLFEAPTIAEAAETLGEMLTQPDAESETAQLLDLVEQLSDAQVAALLETKEDSVYRESVPHA